MEFKYRHYWAPNGAVTLKQDTVSLDHFFRGDFIYHKLVKRRVFYENDLLFYLAYAVTRGGVYVDIGANIGNHAVYFGKYLADFVVCIEPSRPVREQLQKNLMANGLESRTLVIAAGIGKSRDTGRLAIPESKAGNFGAGSVTLGDEGDGEAVDIYPLGPLLAEHSAKLPKKRITLLKIDVEGMGPQVLEGCLDVLKEHHPQIVIEAETDAEYAAITGLLDPLGYRMVGCFCATPTYLFVHPDYDIPREIGVKYRLIDLLRVVEEKVKRLFSRIGRKALLEE